MKQILKFPFFFNLKNKKIFKIQKLFYVDQFDILQKIIVWHYFSKIFLHNKIFLDFFKTEIQLKYFEIILNHDIYFPFRSSLKYLAIKFRIADMLLETDRCFKKNNLKMQL